MIRKRISEKVEDPPPLSRCAQPTAQDACPKATDTAEEYRHEVLQMTLRKAEERSVVSLIPLMVTKQVRDNRMSYLRSGSGIGK
jgi:hypothetical protein